MGTYMIIKLITLVLQFGLPIIDFFLKRAQSKDEMKRKMFEFIEKHSEQILENAKLRKEYQALKDKLKEDKKE